MVTPETLVPEGLTVGTRILLDGEHELHDHYGVTAPALYLLRPDDVIGFRGTGHDGTVLQEYLAGLFA